MLLNILRYIAPSPNKALTNTPRLKNRNFPILGKTQASRSDLNTPSSSIDYWVRNVMQIVYSSKPQFPNLKIEA